MIKLYPPKLFYCKNPIFSAEKNDFAEMKLLFEKAVSESMLINAEMDNKIFLQLYSLYNQATKGDIDIAPPENAGDPAAVAKYNAWASLKGKPIKQAQCEYIMLIHFLKN